MTWRTLAMAACLGACATAGTGPDFAPQPPEMLGEPKLWVPKFQTTTLPNGVTLHVNRDPYLPVVAVAAGLRGGYLLDRSHHAGLGALLADLMTVRAENLSRLQMVTLYDLVGDDIRSSVSPEGTLFRMEVLEDRLPGAINLLAEVIQRPAFEESAVSWSRDQLLAAVAAEDGSPTLAARRALRWVVFGADHPMGFPPLGTARTLAAITPADLQARHRDIARPENLAIAVAGRVDPAEVEAAVRKAFGGWRSAGGSGRLSPRALPAPVASDRRAVHFVPRPGQTQTTIYVGRVGLPETHEQYHRLRIVAGRAARSAGAWLREVENVTYGVGAIDEANTLSGIYGAHVNVDASATATGLKSIIGQFDAQPPGYFDVEKVVVLTSEGLPYYTLAGRAGNVVSLFLRRLPVDHFLQLRQTLDDMTADDMPEVVHTYSRSSKMQIVLVGDPAVIRSQVPPLGLGDLREVKVE